MKFEDQVEEATTFDPSEAPDGERLDGSETHRTRYERLADANTLRWNGAWRDEKRATEQDRGAVLDSIASTFGLKDHQREHASLVLESLPKEFQTAYPTALIITVACMIGGNLDGRGYHPSNLDDNSPDGGPVRGMAESSGFTIKELYKCWDAVQEEL